MPSKTCPICDNTAYLFAVKSSVQYNRCVNCNTIFTDDLSQENLVGGSYEKERNEKHNAIRIERVDKMAEGIPKEEVRILDVGCGNGLLIKDLLAAGYPHVDGYDAYNPEYQKLPEPNAYHIVISVETFEHFSPPYIEVNMINRCLVNYGVCCVETGIQEAAEEDGHAMQDWFYIDPKAGHSTIYSRHGLDLLMCYRGFYVKRSFDKYVKLYQKIVKK